MIINFQLSTSKPLFHQITSDTCAWPNHCL